MDTYRQTQQNLGKDELPIGESHTDSQDPMASPSFYPCTLMPSILMTMTMTSYIIVIIAWIERSQISLGAVKL